MHRIRVERSAGAALLACLALALGAACSSARSPSPIANAAPALSAAPSASAPPTVSSVPSAEPPAEEEAPPPPGLTGQLLFPPLDSDPNSTFPPLPCRAGAKTVIGHADGSMGDVAIAATRLGVVAAWADRPPDPSLPDLPGGSGALHVQPLEPRGAPKGASTEISPRSGGDIGLFPLDDGTFLLAYEEWGSVVNHPLLLHVDAGGAAVGAPVDRPAPENGIEDVSSSGPLIALILRNYKTEARTLLRVDTSRAPMRVIGQDWPDAAQLLAASQMRPDGRVWLLSGTYLGPSKVRLSSQVAGEDASPVEVTDWPSVSLGPQGDLLLVDSGSDPELEAWRLHAGEHSLTKFLLPRVIAPGSPRLSFDASDKALMLQSVMAPPGLTLARDNRPMLWESDSAWTGSSYLAIYVDAGQGQTRNVVVQSVTCGKPKAK